VITPAQIRAGRHLVSLSQVQISKATGLSVPTIKRAESERDVVVSENAVALIRSVLEAAGVVFVHENGNGPGVRLNNKMLKR
jgi:hypothetical protein